MEHRSSRGTCGRRPTHTVLRETIMDGIGMSTRLATGSEGTVGDVHRDRVCVVRIANHFIISLGVMTILLVTSACLPAVPSRPRSGLYVVSDGKKTTVKSVQCRTPPGGFKHLRLLTDNGAEDEQWRGRSQQSTAGDPTHLKLELSPLGFVPWSDLRSH